MSTPDLIIFDLGRVLIDFDFRKVIRDLKSHTPLSHREIHRFFITTPLWDLFERGGISPEDFFARLKKELKLEGLTFKTFTPIWNDIFTEKPDTLSLLQSLRGRHRLALLSNVNAMHWQHVEERYSFLNWFDYIITSYAVGHRKPEAEIFRVALRLAEVKPHQAVFIDDVASHITAARALGIRAYQFHDVALLRTQLHDLFE